MPLTTISSSATKPVDLGECKAHLNLSGSDRWDTLLDFYIAAAVRPAEEALGQTLTTATLMWSMRRWKQVIELPRPPLQSVESVEYKAADGNWTTVNESEYAVNIDAEPGFVRFKNVYTAPDTDPNEPYPWRFTYKAGYATEDGTSTYEQVPAEIRHWMMNHIGTAFMKREADVISMGSVDVVELKSQMARLIKGHRKRVRFG